MKNQNYYLGLDIGTDSVGYAVTDKEYNLIKFKGEPMWGSTVFEGANQSAERRLFRSARRRLDRRQQRIKLLQEIFSKEISYVDENFFLRLKESALFREDTTLKDEFSLFNEIDITGSKFTDKVYHDKYPTIHHLICDLPYRFPVIPCKHRQFTVSRVRSKDRFPLFLPL